MERSTKDDARRIREIAGETFARFDCKLIEAYQDVSVSGSSDKTLYGWHTRMVHQDSRYRYHSVFLQKIRVEQEQAEGQGQRQRQERDRQRQGMITGGVGVEKPKERTERLELAWTLGIGEEYDSSQPHHFATLRGQTQKQRASGDRFQEQMLLAARAIHGCGSRLMNETIVLLDPSLSDLVLPPPPLPPSMPAANVPAAAPAEQHDQQSAIPRGTSQPLILARAAVFDKQGDLCVVYLFPKQDVASKRNNTPKRVDEWDWLEDCHVPILHSGRAKYDMLLDRGITRCLPDKTCGLQVSFLNDCLSRTSRLRAVVLLHRRLIENGTWDRRPKRGSETCIVRQMSLDSLYEIGPIRLDKQDRSDEDDGLISFGNLVFKGSDEVDSMSESSD